MAEKSERFEIQHGGRTLSVARQGWGAQKLYIGAINGSVCAFAPAKGELLRALIQMSRSYPKAPLRRARRTRPRK